MSGKGVEGYGRRDHTWRMSMRMKYANVRGSNAAPA